jgi:phosphatidylglycerophosphate synthase
MNAAYRHEPPREDLGVPTTLTLVRRGIADYLWAHLLAGRPASPRVALIALIGAGCTDMVDGWLARTLHRSTRLGAYLDGLADGSFWLALTFTIASRRRLPRWLVPLLVLRWSTPVLFAAIRFFHFGKRVPLGSTLAGKGAAIAQALTFALALAPQPITRRVAPATPLLSPLIAGFLIAAPLAQLRRMLRGY